MRLRRAELGWIGKCLLALRGTRKKQMTKEKKNIFKRPDLAILSPLLSSPRVTAFKKRLLAPEEAPRTTDNGRRDRPRLTDLEERQQQQTKHFSRLPGCRDPSATLLVFRVSLPGRGHRRPVPSTPRFACYNHPMEAISPPPQPAASAPALVSRQSAPPSGAPRDAVESFDRDLNLDHQSRNQDHQDQDQDKDQIPGSRAVQVGMATEDPSAPSLLSPGIKVEFHGSASTLPPAQPTGDGRGDGADSARPPMAPHPR